MDKEFNKDQVRLLSLWFRNTKICYDVHSADQKAKQLLSYLTIHSNFIANFKPKPAFDLSKLKPGKYYQSINYPWFVGSFRNIDHYDENYYTLINAEDHTMSSWHKDKLKEIIIEPS